MQNFHSFSVFYCHVFYYEDDGTYGLLTLAGDRSSEKSDNAMIVDMEEDTDMLPILYIAGVIIIATVILASGFRQNWSTSIFGAAVGTLTGTLLGAMVGIFIDGVGRQGDAFFTVGAIGAALGATAVIFMIPSRDRKL